MDKWYTVTVLDESKQSIAIMDIVGYSHMSQVYSVRLASNSYTVRDVYIKASSKSMLHKEVKRILGANYWPSINVPQPK